MACGCRKPIKNASLASMAKNFSKAAGKVAIAYVRGREVFSDEQLAKARMGVCMQCSRFTRLKKRCIECGCYLPAKVKLRTEACPLKKWESVN